MADGNSLHRVYVYGTLRPGGPETVMVPGRLYSLGSFPGIVLESPSDEGSFVTCEVVEVDDERLASLDMYEGYRENDPKGSLYLRKPYLDGFIYVYNYPDHLREDRLIKDGDWLIFRDQERGSAASRLVPASSKKEEVNV